MHKKDYNYFIFDFDGILIDDMEAHAEAWVMTFKHVAQAVVLPYEIKLLSGIRSVELVKKLGEKYNFNVTDELIQSICDYKRSYFIEHYDYKPFPIKYELTRLVDQGKTLAVVSGSLRESLKTLLAQFFPGLFTVYIGAEDVTKGKPDPAPYLRCIELLQADPVDCLVIEDGALGIQASLQAGMHVAGIATTISEKELQKATYVFPSHKEFFNHFLYSLERT